MIKNENLPPGWDYNPSSWPQRLPLVIVASIGFMIALYLGHTSLGFFQGVGTVFR